MAGGSRYDSRRARYWAAFTAAMARRVKAADVYLSAQVRADVSQPGTLRTNKARFAFNKYKRVDGRLVFVGRRKTSTVYNFTHSLPFNPPYKQSGNLRMSIAHEETGLVGRVGSNIKSPRYPFYLEKGTRKMRKRPYLTRGLVVYRGQLAAILTRRMKPGELPAVKSNQFRSGRLGAGAKALGY